MFLDDGDDLPNEGKDSTKSRLLEPDGRIRV
jgi:hypothetical protein